MRKILYAAILIALIFLPVRPVQIGELEPIQAIWLSRENGVVVLKTDTQDLGTGETVEEAMAQMKLLSQGIVYPDTAQYLLVSENAYDLIPQIRPYLKGQVKLCHWEGDGELSDAAAYLQAHKTGVRLDRWRADVKLPNLPG